MSAFCRLTVYYKRTTNQTRNDTKDNPMRTTFIVKSLTPETLAALESAAPREAHDRLAKWAFGELKHCVSVKYGSSDAFRDRVEWNGKMKRNAALSMKAEPRKGYRLFTFEA